MSVFVFDAKATRAAIAADATERPQPAVLAVDRFSFGPEPKQPQEPQPAAWRQHIGSTWSAEEWRAFFDERAGMAEYDCGLSRAAAESRALECCIIEWLNRHPAPSAPGRCAWCGKAESPGAVVLPFGTESGTHTWLHAECWAPWYESRRHASIASLGAMGVPTTGQ